jgi:phosphonate transport system ATP-binding protein
MKPAVISFQNVQKVYPNGTVGLKNINLDIQKGEFVAIVGLSGAGKSTFLRTINKMHNISSGDVKINQQSIVHYKGRQLRKLRRNIGMIFQNFNLVSQSTVQRNVLNGRVGYYSTWRTLLGLFSKEDQRKAIEALRTVHLLDKLYTRVDELSGGQQQRVAIARALMQDPQIMLADEPVASLDPMTSQAVMDDLKQLNDKLGITVVVNLHSVPLAMQYASRIIGLRNGKVVYDKPITEVQESDFAQIYAKEGGSTHAKS